MIFILDAPSSSPTPLCFLFFFGQFWQGKWKWIRSVVSDSFVTPWTVAHQAPPSMEFSRQEYWSGLPFPSPGYLPDQGLEPWSPALQADALPSEPPGNLVWQDNVKFIKLLKN